MNQTSRKKEDADKLLQSVKEKAKNPREIQLKGFHIASLYTQAKEYRTALHHVQDYLAVKPNDVRAHRLLGENYEALGDVKKAIQSYRRALELNEMQKDLVLKVAELYCRVGREDYDAERHRYWAERAEKYFPGNPKIYAIMEHIYRKSGKLNDFRTYLQQKMRSRPQDLKLHLQLLEVLIELQKLKDAQQLCAQVEGARLFDQELQWWKKTFQLYQMILLSVDDGDQSPDHIVTFGHMLVSINNLARITLSVHNTAVTQASKLLRVMDKELFRACDYVDASPSCPEQSGAQTVLQEMKAQLYTHLATLLVKMASTGSARWADVVGLVTSCYLVSAQVPSCQEITRTSSTTRGDMSVGSSGNVNRRIYSLAQCRLSEVCHILTSIVKQQRNARWLKQCHTSWCSEEGRQQLLSQAFGQGGLDPASSFLMMDDSLVGARFSELPSLIETVFLYDQESIKSEPASLQRLVWMGLQWDVRHDGILPDLGQFLQPVFSRLLFSTQHLENTSVDNIRLLDIEAFLYCCVHVAKGQQEQLQARVQNLPKTLPLGLCRGMCSPQQLEWYSALYCLYTAKASPSERAKLRLIVQKGLEVLRCRMNHGMETSLLIRLGRTFGQRMQEVQQSSAGDDNRDQWSGFQQMSVMYWQAALEHLQLIARNQAVPTQQKPFFPYGSRPIPADKLQEYQDEGTVAIAQHKFQQGQFQQAVAMLDKTKSADGSYLKAQMYLNKAQTEAEGQGLEVISSPLSRQGELLDKAKHALFDTMDSIQNQPDNPLHEQIQTSLMEIDDQQIALSHEVAALEEEEGTAAGDTLLGSLNYSGNASRLSDVAPLEAAGNDPSPRRLAAELRSLNLSHGRLMEENAQLRSLATTHSRILEQNQQLIDKQNTLMESNNALMKQVLELNVKFQELTTAQAQKAAATPPPPPPPQPIPDINSNRPIIISAAECKIDNLSATQLGGTGYPIMAHPGLASPMPGVASPMHGLPATSLYHHPGYGYYAAPQAYGLAAAGAYETPGLHPSLITSTPAMHAAHVPGAPQYVMFDDDTSPTEAEAPGASVPTGTPAVDVQTNAAFRGGMVAHPTEPADVPQFASLVPQTAPEHKTPEPHVGLAGTSSAPAKAASKAASGQDVSSNSPLLLSMLMDKPEDSSKAGFSKSGSITAGTPPQAFTPVSSKPSTVASTTPSIGPAPTQGFFSGGSVSQPAFGSGQQLASAAPNPTSATTSAPTAMSDFSFKIPQPSSTQLQPVTPAATSIKTTSQSPFAGFSFGQHPSGTGFGLNSFASVGKPSETLQKDNVVDDDDDDDVIFVSEKMPTPDQRARAEALLLPPTFFLYEDEPPCPGCPGCEPEDLAARGKSLPKSTQPAANVPQSHGPSFGSAASVQQTFGDVGKAAPTKETPTTFGTQEPSQPSSIFGGGGGTSTLSFANITADTQGTFAGGSTKGFSFAQAGAQVFGAGAGEDGGAEESHEHDPHYDPIMTLPELVQVKTGEEDEEIMYKQRARLYRYAKDLGVWKERGIGEVKLLRHKQSGALRLIMRREQVLKLCANHRITPDMKLDPLQSSDRSWVWHAIDYSEDEPSHEQLAIKFKTAELAHEFKRRLEELQVARREEEEREEEQKTEAAAAAAEAVQDTEEDVEETKEEYVAGGSSEPDQGAASEDVFAKFKSQAGDWQCEMCMLNNSKDDTSCAACMTPKPGVAPQTGSSSASASNVKFGGGGGFKFGSTDSAAKPDFKFGGPAVGFSSATSLSTPGSSLSTGQFRATQSDTTLTTAKEITPAAPTTQFTFGGGFQKFDLGGAGDTAASPMAAVQSPSAGFAFGASGLTPPKAGGAADTAVASASPAVQVIPVKPSVGYVFGSKPATSTPAPTAKPKQETPKGFSFADIAKSKGSAFSFRLDVSKTPDVSSEKSPVKPKSPGFMKSPGFNKSGDNEYYKDDDGDHIHFEPVVELPENVQVTTGEEGETAKFSHRAKLYRFDKDTSQWKERGLGDIKLLYNPDNRKYRIVMRREQVLKVCANHFVTPELNLKSNAGSTKSWVWMAMDASEDEVQMEQLAVRFKTEETALEFKKAVDAAKEDIKKAESKEVTTLEIEKEKKNDQEKDGGQATKEVDGGDVQDVNAGSKTPDELEAEGSVDDDDDEDYEDVDDDDEDYEDVDDDDDEDDDGEDDEEDEDDDDDDDGGERVGDEDKQIEDKDEQVEDKYEQVKAQDAQAEDKDVKEEQEPSAEGEQIKDEGEQVKDEGEHIKDEGEKVEDKDKEIKDEDKQVEDKDEQVKNQDAQAEDKDVKEEQEPSAEAGDPDVPPVKSCDPNISKAFSELLRSANASHAQKPEAEEATPTSTTDSVSKEEEDATVGAGSKDDSVSEERDDIHFEPVAHLPEQVEKVTGEEDESQLFCSRAKLYRYDKATTQWKDRGIGDIKILHNTQATKYRIIMRRDQVFRVCANHYITKEMSLAPNASSENSLVWQAMDAADGDPQMEQLAVRFKLAGTTQRFKAVFEECQAELRKQTQQDGEVSSTSTESQEASEDKQKEDSKDNKEQAQSAPTVSDVEKIPSESSSSTSDSGNTDSKN
ncbi:E3 SUMO-protein ligase RanBP2-like isoform X2 [Patiria miniata]|uniref:Nuclear pore complex protein Nup153 n=1 Tax=Patiria miniata TaxID=46514 RepID=A0A913ZGW4_PATMI|nr:E3 SUMO-protein ligase RanBP2-like isoform X2 [Patiria miniata]